MNEVSVLHMLLRRTNLFRRLIFDLKKPCYKARQSASSGRGYSVFTSPRTETCQRCLTARRDQSLPTATFTMIRSSSSSVGSSEKSSKPGSLLSKIKWDFGFITGLKYPKSVLNMSGFRMYICCTEMVDHAQFFAELDLPDTFNSWFLVTDLHIWLCMVRLANLGKDGRLLRNCLVKALWEDLEERSKQLGNAASLTARREGVRQMADVFHASLFALDEGLLGTDRDLAGAVWRILLEMRDDVDPQHLELLVSYIRKQVAHLDSQEDATILGNGFVTFLPIHGSKASQTSLERQAFTMGRLRL
ncbi:hypothetical protein BaRGS_00038889 [Batillaria attramentaria]|uniref:Ubiquinol-cytochrome c chaperone domain-containing protein n=1 Tax=Batillaria attramentaria TaxID=370345 RepID=A0ABD0J4S8_9CAEN